MSFGKNRPPLVPDPGQQGDLPAANGEILHACRAGPRPGGGGGARVPAPGPVGSGWRAGSGPPCYERGGVVVWVATEAEFRDAKREGRPAVSMPWPAGKVTAHVPRWKWPRGLTSRH